MKINKISPFKRFRLFKKHFASFAPYLTIRKVYNLILNEIEMRMGVSKPKSLPPFIKIDPSPICNLRCMDCRQNSLEFKKKFNETMNLSMDNLKKVIEPMHKYLLGVSFCVNGEPFSNSELTELISYMHSKKVSVNFPSNFSFRFSDDDLEKLVRSGLDKIYVSLDGISDESYQKYRVGGNFDLIIENVARLNQMKIRLNRKKPVIVWKFVVFDYNAHEVEYVREKYLNFGFNEFRIDYDFHGKETNEFNAAAKKIMVEKRKKCSWLWNILTVLWDGTVYPCCNWYFDDDIFMLGNAYEEGIQNIWRNEKYVALRRAFDKKHYARDMHPFCQNCFGISKI